MPAAADPAAGRLRAGSACIVAWGGLAAIHAGLIAARTVPNAGLRVRALNHVFDAGQLLFLGLVSALVVALWDRLGGRRSPVVVLGLGAALVLLPVLSPDLENFTLRLAGPSHAAFVRVPLVVALAQAIPLAWVIGRRLARPRLRWLAVGTALSAAIVNTQILEADHFGVHAFTAWAAVVLASAALAGAVLPFGVRRDTRRVALGVIAILSLATVTIEPGNAVRVELGRLDTAVLAPHVPPWGRARDVAVEADVPPELAPWFEPRDRAPPVAATEPPLLPPDAIVLLLTIDSMRSDVLQTTRNREVLSTLHRLRETGYYVPRAVTPSTVTRFTIGSLFTGLDVPQLLWRRDSATHPSLALESRPRIAELLAERGVATVHVVSQFELINQRNTIGRGFTEEIVVPVRDGERLAYAPEVMDAILERLQAHRGGPLFLFAHFMDAHHPFDSGSLAGIAYDRHVSEVANIDTELVRLDNYLHSAGLWSRTLLVITADHGQAFGQHGISHHGGPPYEELSRVPLILVGPGVDEREAECAVPLLDLSPTILDAFGAPTPGHFVGRSLLPALRGAPLQCDRPVLSATWDVFGLLLPDGVKIIDNQRKRTLEVYDTVADPRELRNLCDADPDGCAARLALLQRYLQVHGSLPAPPK